MDGKREVRYSLRLPPDVHERLVELAHREGRSLNQQLVYMLRQGLRRAGHREAARPS